MVPENSKNSKILYKRKEKFCYDRPVMNSIWARHYFTSVFFQLQFEQFSDGQEKFKL